MARNTLVGWAPDLGTPTTFVLLRHGETQHTAQRRFSGGTGRGGDPSLNQRGRWQARRAADHLARIADEPGTHHAAHPAIDAIIASPMQRTRETAAAVAERLGLAVTVSSGFTECDFGAWDGLSFAEVSERDPEGLSRWFASTATPAPEGESFEDVQRRIEGAREEVMAQHAGRTVLVVTHVTPIKSLVRLALGAPTESLYRMELSPCSFTSAMWFTDGVASLRFFNDTAHLRGGGSEALGHGEGDDPR